MASMPCSRLTRVTMSIVFSRVLPPAPYVTDTKLGSSSRSLAIVRSRACSPASVLGGKNSNEKTGSPRPNSSSTRITGAI